MNHHNLQYALEEAPFEASGKLIRPAGADGSLLAFGISMPVDTTAGYAPGCVFIDYVAAAVYINTGTVLSCTFKLVTHA